MKTSDSGVLHFINSLFELDFIKTIMARFKTTREDTLKRIGLSQKRPVGCKASVRVRENFV